MTDERERLAKECIRAGNTYMRELQLGMSQKSMHDAAALILKDGERIKALEEALWAAIAVWDGQDLKALVSKIGQGRTAALGLSLIGARALLEGKDHG